MRSTPKSTRSRVLLVGLIALAIAMAIVLPALAETVVYSEGFEGSNGAYTHSGTQDQWAWGAPAYAKGPASAHQGVNCWGTNLTGDVPRNSDSYLTSPAIAIPTLAPGQIARVRFFAWIAVDEMYDRGEFQVSTNGSTWETKGELFHTMQGAWTEYYFDVSSYAGGNLYLRFRCYADGSDAFQQTPYNMAGLYVDDVAVTIADAPITKTLMTLRAYENQSSYSSCPWICPWDGAEYVKDNDIYSTARGKAAEYRDFYKLSKAPVAQDGKYLLQLKEIDNETSHTDLAQLVTVDHAAGVNVAVDERGKILTYANPAPPVSAIDSDGIDATSQVATNDGIGLKVYHGGSVVLDFGNPDVSQGATLVLRAQGFLADGDPGAAIPAKPCIYVQTQDGAGNWVTRNAISPRNNWDTVACDLSGSFVSSKLVRIYVTSCNQGKYQSIDFVGLDTAPQAPITVAVAAPTSAVQSAFGDVLNAISKADGAYAEMGTGQSISLQYPVAPAAGEARDFLFVSQGYYEPLGTFFVYTWDGNGWAQRDGWSVRGNGYQSHDFDLSAWLPDPTGAYKVRIWQDFWYEPAGIDFVGLTRGGLAGTMLNATDLRRGTNVTSALSAIGGAVDEWGTGDSGYPYSRNRNRWVEVTWSGLTQNTPPSTNPVTISDPNSQTPTINWTYADAENDPQAQYEVQVWTGPNGTGTNVWNPPVGSGTAGSILYAGLGLTAGQTYYARVKAFDGTSWGGWSEATWTPAASRDPRFPTQPANVTVNEGDIAENSGTVVDPDGNPITLTCSMGEVVLNSDGTFTWSCPTKDGPGESQRVTITADNGKGGSATCAFDLTVNNVCPTIEEMCSPTQPVCVGVQIPVGITFTDPGVLDTHTVTWNWGNNEFTPSYVIEEAGCGTASGCGSYTVPGFHTITASVTDKDGGVTSCVRQVVIFDPLTSSIKGNGTVGSLTSRQTATSSGPTESSFGFSCAYPKGRTIPTGSLQFAISPKSILRATSFDWLATSGAKAWAQGRGTINGSGNYGFLVGVVDGARSGGTGCVRMKIWNKANNMIFFDNQNGAINAAPAEPKITSGSVIVR